MSLYSKFLKTEMTETDLYNLVLTDQRTHSGPYYMEQHGFDRLIAPSRERNWFALTGREV